MKLRITNIIKETEQAVTICFKNKVLFNKVKYKSGQFMVLKIPINNTIKSRAYSFSSSPYDKKELRITVKKIKGGLVSNYICNELKIGDFIEVEKPRGLFFVKPNKKTAKQYVLFAAGSGITPIYSIVQSVLLKEPLSKVILIYSNQDKENIIFFNCLNDFKKKYSERFIIEHILVKNNDINFISGVLSENILENIFIKYKMCFLNSYEYMICGPIGYLEKVKEILQIKNIEQDRIQSEIFVLPDAKKSLNNDLNSKVVIKYKGVIHNFVVPANKTILQQAMFENIELPHSCKSGMCNTCKANCSLGKIEMIKGHLLEENEVKKGAILTCISYPVSEEVIIQISD